jgi:diacylglycerol kinase (ATP)
MSYITFSSFTFMLIVQQISDLNTSLLMNKCKRWTVIFHPNEKELDEVKVAIAHDTNTANTNEDTSTIFVMNNYFGIGIDANISLAFHNAREENPDKFNNRLESLN